MGLTDKKDTQANGDAGLYVTAGASNLPPPPPAGWDTYCQAVRENCFSCNRFLPGDELKRCSRCKVARYCSKTCQLQHWPGHKHCCQKTYSTSGNISESFYQLLKLILDNPDSLLFNLFVFTDTANPKPQKQTTLQSVEFDFRKKKGPGALELNVGSVRELEHLVSCLSWAQKARGVGTEKWPFAPIILANYRTWPTLQKATDPAAQAIRGVVGNDNITDFHKPKKYVFCVSELEGGRVASAEIPFRPLKLEEIVAQVMRLEKERQETENCAP